VFQDREPSRIFGLKRDDVAGGWRKLHNEKLHNLNSSLNISRVIKSKGNRCTAYVVCMREIRNLYNIALGKPEEKRPRHRWEDNIKNT
jgi:hypothetical protein